MEKKYLYLVKKEVYARNIKEAITSKGVICEIIKTDKILKNKKNIIGGFETKNEKY